MARLALDNSAHYINREASWLAFNRRVLEEAQDEKNPLLERLKFLSISASNLDEFFEVRVAGLVQQIEDGYTEAGPDGLTLLQERDVVSRETHEFVDDQYHCWNDKLRPALSDHGIRVLGLHELDSRARAFVEEYCEKELDLLLTPVTVDPAHPFPRVINKALCVAFLLRRRRRSALTYTGVVTVPRALPRLVRLPSEGTDDFIFLADLVAFHASRMYHGYDIVSSAAFRVTRNSNLYLAEEESRNLLESVRTELHNRRKGDAVRMEIEADADPEIIERLRVNFELEPWQVFSVNGPVNLSRLFNIYEQTSHPDIKFRPFSPRELRLTGKSQDLFEELRRHDILLHHPFDSYDAVVSFIESAAQDPRVLSIKQTLYRTNEQSLIVPALISAAEKKEVTAVVELKARFRRRHQHSLGPRSRRCRRAGVPRTGGIEDPLQVIAAGAARSGWRHPSLCSPWDRKLQREHGPHLYRFEPSDCRSGDHRGGARSVQFSHRHTLNMPTTNRCWWHRWIWRKDAWD